MAHMATGKREIKSKVEVKLGKSEEDNGNKLRKKLTA